MASIIPGIAFNPGEILTPVKLNLLMIFVCIIDEDEVTANKIESDLIMPGSTSTTGILTMTDDRADQFAAITLTANSAMTFVGAVSGMMGTLIVTQDGTGGWTLTLPANSIVENAGGGSVSVASGANAVTVLKWWYDGTNYIWSKEGEPT